MRAAAHSCAHPASAGARLLVAKIVLTGVHIICTPRDMDRRERISDFFAAIGGRGAVRQRIGVGKQALANWATAGVIPARWFAALDEMAADAGVTCPRDLFSFEAVEPEPEDGRAA